ncbi:hypothetical protein REPUB_Repub06bG0194000 [Reevesia pubescens]
MAIWNLNGAFFFWKIRSASTWLGSIQGVCFGRKWKIIMKQKNVRMHLIIQKVY